MTPTPDNTAEAFLKKKYKKQYAIELPEIGSFSLISLLEEFASLRERAKDEEIQGMELAIISQEAKVNELREDIAKLKERIEYFEGIEEGLSMMVEVNSSNACFDKWSDERKKVFEVQDGEDFFDWYKRTLGVKGVQKKHELEDLKKKVSEGERKAKEERPIDDEDIQDIITMVLLNSSENAFECIRTQYDIKLKSRGSEVSTHKETKTKEELYEEAIKSIEIYLKSANLKQVVISQKSRISEEPQY